MLFNSARGVAASVVAVFAAELIVFVAVAGRAGLLAASVISILASVVGVRLLVRVAPIAVARSLQDLSDGASGLLPAGALGGRSFTYRRDVVDATATVKDPARPPASPADRAQAQGHVHELP